jgi:hypothetical protein
MPAGKPTVCPASLGNSCLDGLTEEQARRSLVPSRTTLLLNDPVTSSVISSRSTWLSRTSTAGWPS